VPIDDRASTILGTWTTDPETPNSHDAKQDSTITEPTSHLESTGSSPVPEDDPAHAMAVYWARRGGSFEAFLASCSIYPEDYHTRLMLRQNGITHWTVFLHATVDHLLSCDIGLAAAMRLYRGGAKMMRAMEGMDN